MIHGLFHHYRRFDFQKLAYNGQEEGKKQPETSEGIEDVMGTLPELRYDPTHTTTEQAWAPIETKYGLSAYQQIIQVQVDRYLPDNSPYATQLVADSVFRYTKRYDEIYREFLIAFNTPKQAFNEASRNIIAATKNELRALKIALREGDNFRKFPETIPIIEGDKAVRKYFANYTDALGGRYFNEKLDTTAGKPESNHLEYASASADFQMRMKAWVNRNVADMLERGASGEEFEAFKKEIADRYDLYARADGNVTLISSEDLRVLNEAAHPTEAEFKRMWLESEEKVMARLEVIALMNPALWRKNVDKMGNALIANTINDSRVKEFMLQVLQIPGVKAAEVKDFKSAQRAFKKELSHKASISVKDTVDFLEGFRGELFKDVLVFEQNIEPAVMTGLVTQQLSLLRSGILVPRKQTEKAILAFRNGSPKDRERILSNQREKAILMGAIAEITTHYPSIFDKKYARSIPEQVSKLKTRSGNLEKPTQHDEAAQLIAIQILTNETKVIVSQYNHLPDYQGEDFSAEIASARIPEKAEDVVTGLRYEQAGPKIVQYKDRAYRGGWNVVGMGMPVLFTLSGVVILSNIGQEFDSASGEGIDKVLNTLEGAALNQGVLTGVAGMALGHYGSENSALFKYPLLPEDKQKAIIDGFKLNHLRAKVGEDTTAALMGNMSEWQLLDKLEQGQIDTVMEAAKEKKKELGGELLITDEIIKKSGAFDENNTKDRNFLLSLTQGYDASRGRAILWEQHFAKLKTKASVANIKEGLTGDRHIPEY